MVRPHHYRTLPSRARGRTIIRAHFSHFLHFPYKMGRTIIWTVASRRRGRTIIWGPHHYRTRTINRGGLHFYVPKNTHHHHQAPRFFCAKNTPHLANTFLRAKNTPTRAPHFLHAKIPPPGPYIFMCQNTATSPTHFFVTKIPPTPGP